MSNMVVRTNVFALNAHRNMKNVGFEQGRASNRLSSGFRINSAADDAAGLAISETMRAQIRGLDQASRNAQDGQAMLLTTEGGLEEIGNMLQRTRELLVQASNDTNTQDQRNMIEQEISQLASEVASMQQRVEFNTNRVLAMGPALSSSISEAVARVEADGVRVSESFALVDSNRRAVAEAREMLNEQAGTTTFSELNSRQQAQVLRALDAVDFTTVTGGVSTEINGAIDLPDNISRVIPGDTTPPPIATTPGLTTATLVGSALEDRAHAAINALDSLAAAQTLAFQIQDAANTAATAAGAVAGDGSVHGTALANANATLLAANNALAAAGFEGSTAYADARAALGDIAGLLETYRAMAVIAPEDDPANSAEFTAVRNLQYAAFNLREALDGEAYLATGSNVEFDFDATVPGNTVTQMIGLLNDRDSDLGDAIGELNRIRATMLTYSETQFDSIHDFANFRDTSSSGDFVAWFQVGANSNQGITFDFESVSRTVSAAAAVVNLSSILVANPEGGGGIGRGIEVSPVIQQLQASLDDINSIRANLGAVQNRMDYTMRSLDISSENLQDSESRVRNADVAREMMRFTMSNVLQQAAVSMLSQANQMPNNLLQLLR